LSLFFKFPFYNLGYNQSGTIIVIPC